MPDRRILIIKCQISNKFMKIWCREICQNWGHKEDIERRKTAHGAMSSQ